MSVKGTINSMMFSVLPIKTYLKCLYRWYHHGKLNINNPKRLTEKWYWLKIYNGKFNKELIQKCYDKYTAREYIANKIGDAYLPKLYGIYNNADEIDFDLLPDKYVLKITQSCGHNIINNGKKEIDIIQTKLLLNKWLNEANDLRFIQKNIREESYCFNGQAKIICEEYLEDSQESTEKEKMFCCFNGKAAFMYTNFDYANEDGSFKKSFTRNVYDMNRQFIDVNFCMPNNPDKKLPQLNNFNKMIEISEKLAEDFVFLRVDLYNLDERIVVGELTFIPHGGVANITPIEYDYYWGEMLKLPNANI